MNTKIVITGAGGYIGSVAVHLFLSRGYEVVAVDNFSRGYRGPLNYLQEKYGRDKLKIYEGDLQKDGAERVFEYEKGIEAVVHYAALCSVDESMHKPELYFKNNISATVNLLEAMAKHDVSNIVFSSTCAVYGGAQYMPVDEKHPLVPANPYGESKKVAERIIDWFSKVYKIRYVILRYFNVCGATDDGEVGDSKNPSVHLVQNAVRGALGIEPFSLTYQEFESTPDHSPIRDYVNVVDLNNAHAAALEYLRDGGKSEIINLGTGHGDSVLEIIAKVEEITGKKIERKKSDTPRQGEYDRMVASIDKASRVLGWRPTHTLEDSVRSLIAWYEKHPRGWEK